MVKLPFQVQSRNFGGDREDYWIVLSLDSYPSTHKNEGVTLFAFPRVLYSDLVNCFDNRLDSVLMREDETASLWDCGTSRNAKERSCRVISQGVWDKLPDKRQYTLDVLDGESRGRRVTFSWGGPRKEGWRRGSAYPKECGNSPIRIEMPSTRNDRPNVNL